MACQTSPEERHRAWLAEQSAAAERKKEHEAGQLEIAEKDFLRVLSALHEAGCPGMETRYRRTYVPKHYFTSATKLKRIEIGKGWRIGGVNFLWKAPNQKFTIEERIVQRAAMVLISTGSIVHAEPDDIDHDERNEKFIRTSKQLRTVVDLLSVHLP